VQGSNVLEGRVALVTGAASGIGRATAIAMGAAGASVAVCDVSDAIRATAEDIVAAGGQATSLACDVSDPEQVRGLIPGVVEAFGRLDILVNNAGVASGSERLHETSIEEWDRTIAVNLRGPFLCAKFAIPLLLTSDAASIVNIASTYGLIGAPLSAAYCASKGGVVNLTRQLAVDYGSDGLRVNAICPGYTDTDMGGHRARMSTEAAAAALAQRETNAARQPLGRQASPDEIARVAVFLSSDASSFMTGSIVTVDGGCTATFNYGD
jgi:NAD(P)-dependent dehydrogenase (short-subunit alcohol dehydrogenase family)